MTQVQLVNSFLSFLGTTKQPTSLKFLNELIKAHQEKVKWETLTKIIDWEKGKKTEDYFPSIETYINRIYNKRSGRYLLDSLDWIPLVIIKSWF
ncbi:hypothetical protein BT246_29950 [Bacillus thuringiensis]|uniref:Uncharacterized protein n=1 Tax=Bacillus thuringiensis TaxID=1428 RepID=A0A9W3SC46_BACTU|nr:hypothetical protein BT246_29950 [Bacillus thuringiensis]